MTMIMHACNEASDDGELQALALISVDIESRSNKRLSG